MKLKDFFLSKAKELGTFLLILEKEGRLGLLLITDHCKPLKTDKTILISCLQTGYKLLLPDSS